MTSLYAYRQRNACAVCGWHMALCRAFKIGGAHVFERLCVDCYIWAMLKVCSSIERAWL